MEQIIHFIDVSHVVFVAIGTLLSAIGFMISSIVMIKKDAEKIKTEKSRAEKFIHALDVIDVIESICIDVEAEFQKVNAKLKQTTGSGAGSQKEEVALSRIVEYCKEHGYDYDTDDIRSKIKEFITRSKKIS